MDFGDKVKIESSDQHFMVETIRDFFAGNHGSLYEKLAKDPSAGDARFVESAKQNLFSLKSE